jgi:hypothetical protein
MAGRSLHDALLTVLIDGEVRSRLLAGTTPGQPIAHMISEDDWATLSALPAKRLIGVSRFLARQYYRERIARLFRHVRLLAPLTGRDPCAVLQDSSIVPALDTAVLGSREFAEQLLALIEAYLTDHDEAIQAKLPFWRDLIRYQSTLFRVEAAGSWEGERSGHLQPSAKPAAQPAPRRAVSCHILDLDWDLPGLLQQLRTASHSQAADGMPSVQRTPTTLLIACGRHGRITTVRCDSVVSPVLEAADGQREEQQLAQIAGISPDQVRQLLRQLREIGAIAEESGSSLAEN